jgi:hypothetical protein
MSKVNIAEEIRAETTKSTSPEEQWNLEMSVHTKHYNALYDELKKLREDHEKLKKKHDDIFRSLVQDVSRDVQY